MLVDGLTMSGNHQLTMPRGRAAIWNVVGPHIVHERNQFILARNAKLLVGALAIGDHAGSSEVQVECSALDGLAYDGSRADLTLSLAEAARQTFQEPFDCFESQMTYLPQVGETRLMIVTFPPNSVMMSDSFDPAAAGQEYMEHIPDLAAKFEPDNPGMHTTDTVDYGIILEGEVWLELDDGKQVHLKAQDVVVQNGTRHAWRNKSNKPVKIAFVLIGARRNAWAPLQG